MAAVNLLDGVHNRNDLAQSVAHEIQSGRMADEWILRLEDVRWMSVA